MSVVAYDILPYGPYFYAANMLGVAVHGGTLLRVSEEWSVSAVLLQRGLRSFVDSLQTLIKSFFSNTSAEKLID